MPLVGSVGGAEGAGGMIAVLAVGGGVGATLPGGGGGGGGETTGGGGGGGGGETTGGGGGGGGGGDTTGGGGGGGGGETTGGGGGGGGGETGGGGGGGGGDAAGRPMMLLAEMLETCLFCSISSSPFPRLSATFEPDWVIAAWTAAKLVKP